MMIEGRHEVKIPNGKVAKNRLLEEAVIIPSLEKFKER